MDNFNYGDQMLPPRPGNKKPIINESNKDVPIVIYINGQLVKMDKIEALNVMNQIIQIFAYLETSSLRVEIK